MAIHLRLLPPENIEATLFNREWTCEDEVLQHALTTMTALFERSMGYAPDPDGPIAQEAIRRFGGEIVYEDEEPGGAMKTSRMNRGVIRSIDPGELAAGDPEYFRFIYDLLRGE